jgi:hypothetical protein
LYGGTVLEANADGDLVIPLAPEEANDAPPPSPVVPAPNAMGGDPNDSRDDSGEDDDEDNNKNGGEDPEEEEDDNPCYREAEYHKYTTKDENGQFCVLLEEVLRHLGFTMKPLYVTKHYSEPGLRDYYTSRVYMRVPLIGTNGWRNRSSHRSTTHFSTNEAAINDAARRALWSLCNAYRDQLHQFEFCHIPHCLSGFEETVVPAGGDDRIDILAWVTAALNTDLEGATSELDRYHEELQNAQARIAQLEAQLAGKQPPEEAMSYSSTASPPCKKLRYGTPGATSRLS